MSTRLEGVAAENASVERFERGVEILDGDPDTEVTEEVAVVLWTDDGVVIEGTEERVNDLVARMLASVPAGLYLPVRRTGLASLVRGLEQAAEADTDSLSDMADSLEIVREVAEALRNLLQR